jgi:hypothetical protein
MGRIDAMENGQKKMQMEMLGIRQNMQSVQARSDEAYNEHVCCWSHYSKGWVWLIYAGSA